MFAFLQRLVTSAHATPRARASITPGRLYAKMSSEFRGYREKGGCSCIMPLPTTCAPATDGDCNWQISSLWSQCKDCETFLGELVARYQAQYDVCDPTFISEPTRFNPLEINAELVERLG